MGAYDNTVTNASSPKGIGYYIISTCSFRFPMLHADGRFSSGNLTSLEVIGFWPVVSPSRFSAIVDSQLSSSRLGTVGSSFGGEERLDSQLIQSVSSKSDCLLMSAFSQMGRSPTKPYSMLDRDVNTLEEGSNNIP